MSSVLPFAGVDRRTAWLRATLLAATLLGLLASAPVWFNTRTYPLTPIAPGFPILPAPWDKCLFGLLLTALVSAGWFYRPAVITFLAGSFIAFCQDQNRGQPWLYMYWVMMLLTLFPVAAALAAGRIGMSVVYLWSGIQKFNERYFEVAPKWFIVPAENWHLPAFVIAALRAAVTCTPYVELAIAVAVWIPFARKPAIITVFALHLGVLLFLGPLGHNYNWVIWPWNLAMIGLIWALFSTNKYFQAPANEAAPGSTSALQPKKRAAKESSVSAQTHFHLGQTFRELFRSKPALVIAGLYALLPVLSFAGKWDSDFSFSLYSENQAVANIFVTKAFGDRLPPALQKYVQPFPGPFDPERQGPYGFGYPAWCLEELHVPPIPEPRNFRVVFQYLRAYSREPGDLRMIVGTRGGPVIFYEEERVEFLERR